MIYSVPIVYAASISSRSHTPAAPSLPSFPLPVFILAPLALSEAQLRGQEDLAKSLLGLQFPWMGNSADTWDNAVATVMQKLGEGYELRRHNKEKFECKF